MKKFLKLLLLLLLVSLNMLAQERTISGKVTSKEDGLPITGVSITIGNSKTGVASNAEGNYAIKVPSGINTLQFSYVGFATQTIALTGESVLNVVLSPSENKLNEVVVTAFGIERQKKSLGYSVQELKGDALSSAKTPGLLNAMSGKIAGVQITSSSGAAGGSTRMQIRGASSISSNNQPLFVVDGVPIDNGNYSSTSSIDYGNGASAINPDDIATMSVLKGPAASALYGSRGANGVVLITTKTGKAGQGLGIDASSNLTYETPFRISDYQNEYGQGTQGKFSFVDGNGGGLNDAIDESWGPKLDGRLIAQFDSPVDASGKKIPTPWIAHPDNVKNFYELGRTFTNNLAITGGTDKGDFRLSMNNLDTKGMLPNTDYKRTGISVNAGYKINQKLSVRVTGNYLNDGSDNRASTGAAFTFFGRQIDISQLKNYLLPGSIDQFNWNYSYANNPYYSLNESTKANNKDRLYGNLAINYDITPKISLLARTGTDFSSDRRKNKTARFNATRYGAYGEEEIFVRENNSDFLFTHKSATVGDLTFSGTLGGNHRSNYYQRNYMYASELAIPNVFNLGNSRQRPTAENSSTKKEVNSFYGSTQIAYKQYLYLDLTARNDWSSTLAKENNSYFYPGASVSFVVSDALKERPKWLNYLKIRSGLARVGNDTDPYMLRQVFVFENPWGELPTVSANNALLSSNLKPEITSSFEAGLEMRLFNGRMGADFTYYTQSSKNQILNANISTASGYTAVLLNAGELANKGFELQLYGSPISTQSGFKWETIINYSRNRNKVVALAEGLTNYQLGAIRGMSIEARVGEPYGNFFGTEYLRAPDGQLIFQNGLPQTSANRRILGSFTPDWIGGITNVFSYKNISLHTLIDAKWGGDLFSYNILGGQYAGQLVETLPGREEGIIGKGVKNTGTTANPTYVPNDIKVSAEDYYHNYYFYNNNEAGVYDASYIKLREVKLSYSFTPKTKSLPFRKVNLGVYGRNLALLYSKVPHIDPESSYNGSASNAQGVDSGQLPSARSIGFNINLTF